MASACVLEWVPDSLYNTAVSAIVALYSKYRKELKSLPENVQFDVYYKLYNKGRLCELALEFTELELFARVLKVSNKRHLLHNCFQAVLDHGQRVTKILANAYSQHCCVTDSGDSSSREKAIQLGFSLGGFFSDAGWYPEAEQVFRSCLQLLKQTQDLPSICKALECCIRLLHTLNAYCKFDEAERTWQEAQGFVEKLRAADCVVNSAVLHSEYCTLLFAKSLYNEAFRYCCNALEEITPSLPPKAVVDVLRQCSKACVVKREFKKAEMLIKCAVQHARENFGPKHHKYSDALLDYGFYLLNVDAICQAVQVYQAALDIRIAVFGGNNLHVAIAHEDLAYCSYVHEYSSGKFDDAEEHAVKAIEIITRLLPEDHLLLASSKRVKALILEEIAIDSHNKELEDRLLQEAHDLHLASLQLAKKAFGEDNVQTAKHYGNLGRLYQSMHFYEEAEQMHLKAIAIKERLLAPEDYEVALSVGHLASLYNYDMQKFDDAEKLYKRSVAIGRKLFGLGYSGLEYDYRGLLRLYQFTGNTDKAYEYSLVLHEWNRIRDHTNSEEKCPLELTTDESVTDVVQRFFAVMSADS
ncbi:hypothetical protein NP493_12g07051 [Ridgeia piscesae]|uniref:Amyloid protein-binding protein 2 n=1 Tax=Ridgeia piscesae TaxID=27915 RepID=A0AAD9UL38_RIDPI|nr:hypothetical protein NP493_12g07051 [Ridgeia piscesae]